MLVVQVLSSDNALRKIHPPLYMVLRPVLDKVFELFFRIAVSCPKKALFDE